LNGKSLAIKFYKVVLQARIYHFFFWIIYTLFVALAIQPGRTPKQWVMFSGLILSFHAAVSYFNNYILMGRFLYRRRHFVYGVLLTLTIVAASFPIAVITHKLVNNQDLKNLVWSWNFFLLIVLSVFFSVMLSMVLKLLKNWYQEEQINKHLQQVNLETELKFLRNQINPHFLFNSLNNLYALTLKKSEQAPEVVLRLSNILRYVLYESGDGRVSVEKEIQYLKDYIDLEKIRVGDRVKIDFSVEGETAGRQVPPLLFLTFVENSFKHGAENALSKGWISIALKLTPNETFFEVANSKNNAENTSKSKAPGGIGMVNLKKRLDLLYRGKYSLKIDDTELEYKASLILKN
jgi:sensor histidine kinase YesM